MYAMLGTRPDIAYAVTSLSQFSHNPGFRSCKGVRSINNVGDLMNRCVSM